LRKLIPISWPGRLLAMEYELSLGEISTSGREVIFHFEKHISNEIRTRKQ